MARKLKDAPHPGPQLITEDRRKHLQSLPLSSSPHLETIYADALMNIGLGPAVSRFTLGIENENKTLSPHTTVIIPTHRLIEGLTAIQNGLVGNVELKDALIKGIDQIKMTIEKI